MNLAKLIQFSFWRDFFFILKSEFTTHPENLAFQDTETFQSLDLVPGCDGFEQHFSAFFHVICFTQGKDLSSSLSWQGFSEARI